MGSHLHEVSCKRDPFCSKSRKQRSDSKRVLSSSLIFQSLRKIVAKRSVTCFGAFGTVKGIMQMATSASP